jgi:predicted ATPase
LDEQTGKPGSQSEEIFRKAFDGQNDDIGSLTKSLAYEIVDLCFGGNSRALRAATEYADPANEQNVTIHRTVLSVSRVENRTRSRDAKEDISLNNRFVLISGCSGGGKSTLLAELSARGHAVVEEPGRRIIAEELATAGKALPWVDQAAFLRRAIDMALADRISAAAHEGWVFFDRGLVDAASALETLTGEPVLRPLCTSQRYHRRVFMAPPWPEIYVTDPGRQHGFEAATAEYHRLMTAFPALDYDVINLPQTAISARADFVQACLGNVA